MYIWQTGWQLNNQPTNHSKPTTLSVAKWFPCIQSRLARKKSKSSGRERLKDCFSIIFVAGGGGGGSDRTAVIVIWL